MRQMRHKTGVSRERLIYLPRPPLKLELGSRSPSSSIGTL